MDRISREIGLFYDEQAIDVNILPLWQYYGNFRGLMLWSSSRVLIQLFAFCIGDIYMETVYFHKRRRIFVI